MGPPYISRGCGLCPRNKILFAKFPHLRKDERKQGRPARNAADLRGTGSELPTTKGKEKDRSTGRTRNVREMESKKVL